MVFDFEPALKIGVFENLARRSDGGRECEIFQAIWRYGRLQFVFDQAHGSFLTFRFISGAVVIAFGFNFGVWQRENFTAFTVCTRVHAA